jgi:hypothetical protein
LICELCKTWLVSQARASHGLARSVQGSLFDFIAALEPVITFFVFDLDPAAWPNHNPNSFLCLIWILQPGPTTIQFFLQSESLA